MRMNDWIGTAAVREEESKRDSGNKTCCGVLMTKKKRQMRSGMRVGYGRHDTRRMKKRGDFGAAEEKKKKMYRCDYGCLEQ